MSGSRRLACLALWIAVGSPAVMPQQEQRAQQRGAGTAAEPKEFVLFPFDDYSIPLTYGLSYNLVQGNREGVVLRPAKSGPDSQHIINHGSVVEVDGEFRMWYLCAGDQDPPVFPQSEFSVETSEENPPLFRVCYAVSRDGINWERPALGLVKYGTDTNNNLIDLPMGKHRMVGLVVIDEPDDPVPERRFKMIFYSRKYLNRLGVAFSPDGLRWKESPLNPVTKHGTEIHGLTKFEGAYYVNGHAGSPRAVRGRKMVTYMSYDFENWTDATALSFERKGGEIPLPWKGVAGEQVHVGASLWNRGNVILGFYGMWHGHPSDDRRMVTMDLGLVVSHDALHFKEPIPDFRIIAGNEEGEIVTHTYFPRLGDAGGGSLFGLALTQAQGWANVGDLTLYWYSVWSQGRIRLATWARDRFGYFEVPDEIRERAESPASRGRLRVVGDRLELPKRPTPASPWTEVSPHFVSYPMRLDGSGYKVFVNADGLSEDNYLKVEVSDLQFRALPGYSTDDSVPITESGFRQPAEWAGQKTLGESDQPIRVRVNFVGDRPEDIRVYAVYVATN